MKDFPETIRQDVETIKNNQFKVDLKSFKHKLVSTTESLNLKFDALNEYMWTEYKSCEIRPPGRVASLSRGYPISLLPVPIV